MVLAALLMPARPLLARSAATGAMGRISRSAVPSRTCVRYSRGVVARPPRASVRRVDTDRVLRASLGFVAGGTAMSAFIREKTSLEDDVNDDPHRVLYRNDDDSVSGQLRMAFQSFKRRAQHEMRDENQRVIAALIATNVGVWGLWRVSFRSPRLHAFMWRHFACSYNAVVEGKRFHTLFTSAFSHITLPHIGINMFMLWQFGSHIIAPKDTADAWLRKSLARSRTVSYFNSSVLTNAPSAQLLPLDKFFTLYASSALASSMLSIVASRFRGTPATFTIGASGAVMGVLTVYCLLFPEQRMRLYGFIDLTAGQLLQLMTAVNVVGSAFQRGLHIDFTGHLGGQAAGLVTHESKPRLA